MKRSLVAVLVAMLALPALQLAGGPSAGAQEPDPLVQDSLTALSGLVDKDDCKPGDALDGDTANGLQLPYVICNDGLPPPGGGESSIPVPVKYKATATGDDYSGLPDPASLEEVAAATAVDDLRPERENRISLDVDISLPPTASMKSLLGLETPVVKPPKGGYPVIVFMHGCCGGSKRSWEAATVDAPNEQWHHSNAWFASRGYVVINYTARGFRNNEDRGSTGTTQLNSRRYEINDYQYLVGLLADHDRMRREAGEPALFRINPRKVATVGGSYGGGFAWLALTDPTWESPANNVSMRLASVVTKYGWTDLVESLIPSGHYRDRDPATGKTFIAPVDPAQALSREPLGVLKQSIVAGLYATGNQVAGDHTTFPDYVHEGLTRLQQGEPYDEDPALERLADSFIKDRSAYYQEGFWNRLSAGDARVPVYAAATWTDPLFPTMETVRFYNKLKSLDRDYPITMYLGDYQHFAQNKAKEWDDLCGSDHHVCQVKDYTRADGSINLMKTPSRVRKGVNWRMNKFLDFYLRGKGKRPQRDVSATSTICPANATDKYKADEPGAEYRAPSWRALAPTLEKFSWGAGGAATSTTTSTAVDGHAQESDPVTRDRQANKCFTTQSSPGPGVVVYEDDIRRDFTMMGIPTLKLEHETTATDYWIAARLFDKKPDGTMTMVTRGVCRVNKAASPDETCQSFDLFGNGWMFEKGHKLVIEVTQSDQPFLRRDNLPSTVTYKSANIELPVAPEALKVDFRG